MPVSDDFLYRAERLGLKKLADLHEELRAATRQRDVMEEAGENVKLLDAIIKDLQREIDEESKNLD
jgi:hypothetical protein